MAVLGQSSLGTMRLNAARLNYHNAICYVTINGVARGATSGPTKYVRYDRFTIRQTVNSTPDTCELRVWNFVPVAMQDIKVYVGSTAATELIFGGTIQRVEQIVEAEKQANVAYDLHCVDYSWLMDRRLVFKNYVAASATAVAQDIIASFTSGYTSNNVQPGLPMVSISFSGVAPSLALTQLAQLVGAHWKMSYTRDLRFVTTSTIGLPDPATLTASNMSMDAPFTAVTDGSQVRTRLFVIGKGTTAAAPASVGDTVLAVDDATLLTSGSVVVNGQRVGYTGLSVPNGTVVGPGAGPTAPPTVIPNSSASSLVADAIYQYAYTDVTGAGETTPGPAVSIIPKSTNLPAPTETVSLNFETSNGGLSSSSNYQYELTVSVDGGGETTPGPSSGVIATNSSAHGLMLNLSMTLQAGSRYINVYRTTAGGSTFFLAGQIDLTLYAPTIPVNGGNYTTFGYFDTTADGSLGAAAPSSNTASRGAIGLSGIAVGPASVTQRKIYRTAANGSQLKLLTTIANNTATTFTDTIADASLGANAPSSDTSGLTQPTGTVSPGSTSIRVAGTGAFPSTGGWAIAGGMSVRYTTTDSQNLLGVPSSGVGSLTSTLSYGTAIILAPLLTGIASSGPLSISSAVNVGDSVRPYVQRDDTTAQAALAALEGGGDGVHEDKIDDDTLVTAAAMNAAGDAELSLFKAVESQNEFSARDYKLQCGATVTINVGAPTNVTGSRTIQSVTVTQLNQAGSQHFLYPLRTVDVGTTRLTLPEYLRQLGL